MARKVKAKVRLDLGRNVKGSKKGFCKHIDDKMKIWENVGTFLNGPEVLTTQVLHVFFVSVFTRKIDLQGYQAPENKEDWCKNNVLLGKEYHIRE